MIQKCPACKCIDDVLLVNDEINKTYHIECDNCHHISPKFKTETGAVDFWNKRAKNVRVKSFYNTIKLYKESA